MADFKANQRTAGTRCTVCNHPEVDQINKLLINNAPYRTIADQFDISVSALGRHKRDHLPDLLARAKESAEVAQADDLLSQIQLLQSKALAILQQAERSGELKTALHGIREARACLELLARVEGQLQHGNNITVNITQQRQVITNITQILTEEIKDPAILYRVSSRLNQLEGS